MFVGTKQSLLQGFRLLRHLPLRGFAPRNDEHSPSCLGGEFLMTKEHKKAILIAAITLALIIFVTFFRNGTSW
ncbi:MAG TPA: hypothetical protein DGH68_08480 [Bacteroidetes bacterium]|nr:hypothetical protein [Bacteroidota bacterium]